LTLFRKFATAAILDAQMGADAGFSKSAHRAVFNYTPRDGYLYVRSRAISSRCNDNFDMFPAGDIESAYKTFLGKPVFVNHHNDDHRRARGVIIDAALHKDINPDGSPDTWVELLHEVDAVKFPKLAKAILAKEVNRTSMGCDVQFSKCSVCHNVATSPLEYCAHIPSKKGKRIYRVDPSTGKKEGTLVFEICSGLSFFENSLLVEQPADPTAYFLGEVESGRGLDHLKASIQTTASVKEPQWNKKNSTLPMQRTASLRPTQNIWSLLKQAADADVTPTHAVEQKVAKMPSPTSIWSLIREADRIDDDSLDGLFQVESAFDGESPEETIKWHRLGNVQPPTNSLSRQAKLNDPKPDAPLVRPPAAGGGKDYTAEENTDWNGKTKAHAEKWAKRNPMHPQNVIDHWNHATPDEKANGKTWYPDASATSNHIADATGTPRHVMAGLVSNYSPQTHWATNVITAAKSARLKQGLGGKGNDHGHSQFPEGHPRAGQQRGIMASEGQKKAAETLLNGTHDEDETRANGHHYEQVLKGPKTQAFARLIHNGGDDHSVVVDRHAYSVASGARASDAAYGHSGLGGKKKYQEAADIYKTAAQHISNHEGETIHPHQVQAVTWLVRQRLNEEGDTNLHKQGGTSAAAAHRSIKEMHSYLGEHHPEASLQMPGTGYSKETGLVSTGPKGSGDKDAPKGKQKAAANFHHAYGETKAPQDVDTLRAENCTVCGNSSAFDGKQCQVCGYVAPPKAFGDPNTDVARDNDLRKQVLDGDQADPMDTDQPMGNQQGDPEELGNQDADAEAGEDTQLPMLTCVNCGTGVQPAPPASDGGEPPYPAEGDACPVCKKGQLLSGAEEGAEEGDDPAEGDDQDLDHDGIPDKDEDEDGDGVPDDQEEEESDEAQPEQDDEDEDLPPKKKKDN
jgi:hypothetical protein